ncbi:MAG TPA: hypothetical protein PKC14_00210 [Candidatus Absconditabacterales bacterium]|nr:hypothetical protein [Candidatus Absconditabacterales bacterium]
MFSYKKIKYFLGLLILLLWIFLLFFIDNLSPFFSFFTKTTETLLVVDTGSLDTSVSQSDQAVTGYDLFSGLNVSSGQISSIDVVSLRSQYSNDLILEQRYDIDFLKQLYDKTQKFEVLEVLVGRLVDDLQFDEALQLISDVQDVFNPSSFKNSSEKKSFSPLVVLYVYFNSSEFQSIGSTKIEQIKQMLKSYRDNLLIKNDDYLFYDALLSLLLLNIDDFQKKIDQIASQNYLDFQKDVRSYFAMVQKRSDYPAYYLQGLMGLVSFKHGYYVISQQVSAKILVSHENYILPYQILAYSHFLMNNWDVSLEYFQKLVDLDVSQKDFYRFLIGICNYWLGKYNETIIYLSQLQLESFKSDIYRYLFLSYDRIGDEKNMMTIFQQFSNSSLLQESDYYFFFYRLLYLPYFENKSNILFQKNSQLILDYFQQCYKQFINNPSLCRFGKAGISLAQNKVDDALKDLLALLVKNPQSYIYQVVGDIYYRMGQLQKSKDYYVKAIQTRQGFSESQRFKQNLIQKQSSLGTISE